MLVTSYSLLRLRYSLTAKFSLQSTTDESFSILRRLLIRLLSTTRAIVLVPLNRSYSFSEIDEMHVSRNERYPKKAKVVGNVRVSQHFY